MRDTKYFVQRTIEPHDPTGMRLSDETLNVPRPVFGAAREPDRNTALPLQLRAPAPSLEVRQGNEDSGDASGPREKPTDIQRDLLMA